MSAKLQSVDPTVSQRKFEREVAEFQKHAKMYQNRGWFLLKADFPHAHVMLATSQTVPPAIVCGVMFDYSNYDAAPPSVKLVNPFTSQPYRFNQLPTFLRRLVPNDQPEKLIDDNLNIRVRQHQALMVAQNSDDIPFICIAGVREYHEHPAHTGDAWQLHRPKGAGRLVRLLQVIAKYGVDPIVGLQVQMVPQISFQWGEAPE